MKKTLSMILAFIMLILVLMISSCNVKNNFVELDTYNGMTPEVALREAFERLDAEQEIEITMSSQCKMTALTITCAQDNYPNACVYTYNGSNASRLFTEGSREQMDSGIALIGHDRYGDDTYFVDGICYVDGEGGKIKYSATECPIDANITEQALRELLEYDRAEIKCYEEDGRIFLYAERKNGGEFTGADRGTGYTICLDDNGRISEISGESRINLVFAEFIVYERAVYNYDNVSDIVLPEDAEAYIEQQINN